MIETGEAVCVESVLHANEVGGGGTGQRRQKIQQRACKPGRYIEPHVKNKMQEAADAERTRVRQLLERQGGHAVEEDAAKYSRERANRDVRLKRRGRAKQRAGHRQTRGGEAIAWKAGWTC
ncbi:hypothetical protein PMAC_003400, partial [Pneumocystis sp. 'macacae']